MLIKAGKLKMEEKYPKSPKQESVQQKKGAMWKCGFSKKFGYMDAMIITLGLSVGLLYYGHWVVQNPGKPYLGEVEECKEEDDRESSTMGKSFLIALIMVGISISCQFLVALELFFKPPKLDTIKTLKLFRICMTSGVLMLTVEFVGMMLGYPDTEVCLFFIVLSVILEYVLVIIMIVGLVYTVNEKCKEENQIMEEEAMELGLISAEKIETV